MLKKMKRTTALILSAFLVMSVCSGCNETPQTNDESSINNAVTSEVSKEESETVERLNIYSEEFIETMKDRIAKEAEQTDNTVKMMLWTAGDDFEFEKSLVEEFQELYADDRYTFKIKVNGSIAENSSSKTILENPQGGADVFQLSDDYLSSLAEEKVLAPVDSLFLEDVRYENTDSSIEVCSHKDKLYAFPRTSDNGYFLYYDKRVLSEEDVKDMDTMIQKSAEQDRLVYFNIANAWYNSGIFMSAGVQLQYKDGIQTANFDSEEGLKAAKAMAHLAEKHENGFIGSNGETSGISLISDYFREGKFAAIVMGTWAAPGLKKTFGAENLGAAKLPTILIDGEQVQLHSFGGYKIVGVNAYSQYPATSQLLAYYLTNSENQIKRYEERGYIPTSKTALETDKIKNDPAITALEEQRPYAHPQGTSVGESYWRSEIADFVGEIVTAKGDIDDETLKLRLSEIQKYLDDNNKE